MSGVMILTGSCVLGYATHAKLKHFSNSMSGIPVNN